MTTHWTIFWLYVKFECPRIPGRVPRSFPTPSPLPPRPAKFRVKFSRGAVQESIESVEDHVIHVINRGLIAQLSAGLRQKRVYWRYCRLPSDLVAHEVGVVTLKMTEDAVYSLNIKIRFAIKLYLELMRTCCIYHHINILIIILVTIPILYTYN